MVKAVIFDYFGVISSDDYWKFVRHNRDRASEFRDYASAVNNGEMHWSDFIDKVAQATGTDVDRVNELYESERIDPRVVHLIAELHTQYKTGLITNANHEFIDDILHKNNLKSLFDAVVVSSRLGYSKPDPRIFRDALTKLGVAAEETVYFDDLAMHVDAAKNLGINAFVYENYDQAKKQLDQILSQK